MFFQPPDDVSICNTSSKTFKSNARSRRQKKLRRKNKLKAIKKYQNQLMETKKLRAPVPSVPITMSSWAEAFTKATTWQLKNEVAFWKAKAKALEYENQILHRTIRQNSVDVDLGKKYYVNERCAGHDHYQLDTADSDCESSECEEVLPSGTQPSDLDFEVSEEYIQFLRDNQVYRDFAKKERERLKAAENDAEKSRLEEMEAGPTENAENSQEKLKKLYGHSWERISALETNLKTQFISIFDQEKPMYWPNIPLNFNFG